MRSEFFDIVTFTIKDVPILQSKVQEFAIFTSIESVGIQFKCLFNDIADIKASLPLKGGEDIVLVIVDKFGKQVRFEFTLTETREELRQGQKDSFVSVKGVSKKGFELSTQRLYYSYEKSPSSIVNGIDTAINVTDTFNKVQVVCPGWPKNKFIQYLANLSRSKKYGGNYLFFEDLEGIHFKPLNQILDITEADMYTLNERNTFYRYNILDFKEKSNFDILEASYINIYNNKMVGFDPNTKTTFSEDLLIDDVNDEMKTIGFGKSYNLDWVDKQEARTVIQTFHNDDTLFVQERNQMIFDLYAKKADIMINGDFNVQVGSVIYLKFPDRYNQTEYHIELGGAWLVEKVAYHFSPDEFVQKMRIVKNASYDGTNRNTKNNLTVKIKQG